MKVMKSIENSLMECIRDHQEVNVARLMPAYLDVYADNLRDARDGCLTEPQGRQFQYVNVAIHMGSDVLHCSDLYELMSARGIHFVDKQSLLGTLDYDLTIAENPSSDIYSIGDITLNGMIRHVLERAERKIEHGPDRVLYDIPIDTDGMRNYLHARPVTVDDIRRDVIGYREYIQNVARGKGLL